MKYPSFEKRITRAQATKTLSKICQRLDDCAIADSGRAFTYRPGLIGPVRALRLWVAGSYSRGALDCGDLDLILEIDNNQYYVSEVNRLLFKNPQRVSLYIGTPGENSSYIAFPDAVLVWEPGMDWRAALANIVEDPQAARFARAHDQLPFRLQQLKYSCPEWAEEMLDMKQRGELQWHYVPLEDMAAPAEPSEQWLHASKELTNLMDLMSMGKASKKLLPFLATFIEQYDISDFKCQPISKTSFTYWNTTFVIGEASNAKDLLNPHTQRLVVIPPLSLRGPNGFWVIERGPKHPLVRMFANSEVWAVGYGVDWLCMLLTCGEVSSVSDAAVAVEIFRTEAEALEGCVEYNTPESDGELLDHRAIKLSGRNFLNILAKVDMLATGNGHIAFSRRGALAADRANLSDNLEQCTIAELAARYCRPKKASLKGTSA